MSEGKDLLFDELQGRVAVFRPQPDEVQTRWVVRKVDAVSLFAGFEGRFEQRGTGEVADLQRPTFFQAAAQLYSNGIGGRIGYQLQPGQACTVWAIPLPASGFLRDSVVSISADGDLLHTDTRRSGDGYLDCLHGGYEGTIVVVGIFRGFGAQRVVSVELRAGDFVGARLELALPWTLFHLPGAIRVGIKGAASSLEVGDFPGIGWGREGDGLKWCRCQGQPGLYIGIVLGFLRRFWQEGIQAAIRFVEPDTFTAEVVAGHPVGPIGPEFGGVQDGNGSRVIPILLDATLYLLQHRVRFEQHDVHRADVRKRHVGGQFMHGRFGHEKGDFLLPPRVGLRDALRLPQREEQPMEKK